MTTSLTRGGTVDNGAIVPPDMSWEAAARELYAAFRSYELVCFFCEYKTGHAKDCRWDALDAEVGTRDELTEPMDTPA